MRVLIDCTQITRDKAGVGIYALNMLREMIPLDPAVSYLLLVQDDDPTFRSFASAPNVQLLPVSSRLFRKLPLRFLLEQLWIPVLALFRRIDVLHSLHYSFPLVPMRAKKVSTFHDMTMLLMPEVHLRSKVRYFGFFIRAGARRADYLVFDSQSSMDDFRRLFPQSRVPGHVATLGKSPAFRAGLDQTAIAEVVQRSGLKPPYVLYVGTLEPRKNLHRLIESFASVAALYPDLSLALAGKMGWMCDDLKSLAERFGIADRVVFPGFVAEDDKPLLIAGAHLFAYPSLYEGFGIPLLESMACGIPTLSSRSSSLVEVAGDGALLIDPLSIEQIADGLAQLVANPDLRQDLIARGLIQAGHFTWMKTAQETLRAYRAVSMP